MFDSYKKEEFILKATLLWVIHDFSAYRTLSECNVHGYLGCPVCREETESTYLDGSKKIFFHSHRRFLPASHKFRSLGSNFLPKGVETRSAPLRLSG